MKKWLVALVLCLAVMLGCCVAFADGIVIKNESGTVLNDGDSVSGQFYYKFYVEGLPEDCNELYFAWTENMNATEPDGEWEDEPRGLEDENGRKVLYIMPEIEGNYDQEIMFARVDENSEIRRIVLQYNRSAVLAESAKPVITNTVAPTVGQQNYQLEWTPVEGVQYYQIVWDLPGDDAYETYWSDSERLDLRYVGNDPTTYIGEHRVRVYAFADGRLLQASDNWNFTITAPNPELRVSNEKQVTVNNDGSLTVPFHQWIDFEVSAEGSNGIGLFCLDEAPSEEGEWLNQLYGDDRERYVADSYSGADWEGFMVGFNDLPNDQVASYTKYVVAEAYYNFWSERKLTVIPVHVTVDTTVTGSVSYTVPTDVNTVQNGTVQLARDGILYVDVKNEGNDADYYGMYIAKADVEQSHHWPDWIADSHWIEKTDGATTRVPLTIPRCEAGQTYQVHVYAIKFGAPQIEAASTISISVQESDIDECPVTVSMKDTYATGDPLRVFAHYSNPNNIDGTLVIRIYDAQDPDHVVYDEGGEFEDFWDDSSACWESGTYVVEALITQWNWNNMQVLESYPNLKTITVTSSGQTAAPQAQTFATLIAGQDLEMELTAQTSGDEVAPEWFEYALFRTDWDYTFISAGKADITDGAGTITIDKDTFEAGGQYQLRLFGMTPGYDVGVTQFKFLVIAPDLEENLTLTVNGSSTAEQSILSSSNVHVEVSGYQIRPTMIRVLNGDNWDFWHGEDDFERDWGYGDDDIILYAEATWDDIDFEELDRSNWENFEPDEINWSAKSNVVLLHVTSPNGEMVEPNFTIQNAEMGEEGSGVIPWGDDLILNIQDEGPMGISANGGVAQIINNGWFFCNIEVERNDGNNTWWDRISDEFKIKLNSGVNHIPTYWMEDNCHFRMEVGADAEGYSGRARWVEFRLGEKRQSEETIKTFTVNGDSSAEITVDTHEELWMLAYHSDAEWYDVLITRQGDNEWDEHRNENRNGMLNDNWRADSEGTYILTAYAYGHLPEGETDENGNDVWEDLIGSKTIHVKAESGDLGELNATMKDKAYLGDQIEIKFSEVTGAEEYSYWIHTDHDNNWVMGDSRQGVGSLFINTNRLGTGVYWVELDAMAQGYNQTHHTLHFALIENESKDYSAPDDSYYFYASDLNIPTETNSYILAYVPGAEEIQLSFRKDNNEELEEIDHREGPGLSTGFCRGDAGTYQIYVSYCTDNGWSEPVQVQTITVTAGNEFNADPIVTVNGSATGNTAPVNQDNNHKLTVVIDRDENAQGYHVQVNNYGDGWRFFDEFIDLSSDEHGDWITIGDGSITIEIEDGNIEPGRLYEINCWAHAPDYECRGMYRMFLLQDGQAVEGVTMTVSPTTEDGFWTAEAVRVEAAAENATAIWIHMNNEERWYRGSEVDDRWNIWDQNTVFYAYATTDEIPEDDNFNWGELDVNWSMRSELVTIQAQTEGDTEVPTLTFKDDNNHVTKGDWLEFTIGNDGDARQMDIRIKDDQGNEYEFRRYWAPGTYRITTANLESGHHYWVSMNCVQSRHLWTNGPKMDLYVDAPQQDTAFFRVDKNTLYPDEPFIPTVYATGAEHIWIGESDWDLNTETREGIWGDWDGDNGTNGADWEWWYDDPGAYSLSAWAQYPEQEGLTLIDTIEMTVLEPTALDKAEILVPNVVDVTDADDREVRIPLVENGYFYELQLHYRDQETEWTHMYLTADDADTENGREYLTFVIGEDELLPNQSYWIDCYVEPRDRDYGHFGSDSSKNIMTVDGTGADTTISLALSGQWTQDDEDRYQIPINTGFDVIVTATGNTYPTAIAVYMGDQVKYSFFNDGDGSASTETVRFSEYQAWPETIYARAYHGDLSDYDSWEEVPWDELGWGATSIPVNVIFTSMGSAGAPRIEVDSVVMTGWENIFLRVDLGENANEAHANLDRNIGGWEEDLVFDGWIEWSSYGEPDDDGYDGDIIISTKGLESGVYRLHVDNSGENYDNSRTSRDIYIVEYPYESGPRIELPSGLTEIGEEAFEGISARVVIIPYGVTKIGRRAFADSDIELVVIPETVTEIADGAFEGSELSVVYGYNQFAEGVADHYNVVYYDLWRISGNG